MGVFLFFRLSPPTNTKLQVWLESGLSFEFPARPTKKVELAIGASRIYNSVFWGRYKHTLNTGGKKGGGVIPGVKTKNKVLSCGCFILQRQLLVFSHGWFGGVTFFLEG